MGKDISTLISMAFGGNVGNSFDSDRTVLVSLYRSEMYYMGDEEIAKDLQRKLNSSGVDSPARGIEKENMKLTDSILEYHDPTPNIHDLFVLFDKKFFWGKLGMVEVKWSNRMTSCAGLCYYQGKRGLCLIKLSAPLLSLRPRKDLVETLLHEMIHAYLFVTANYRDRDDHGPEFHKHMHRINQQAGTKITVYHTFLDEVAYYQKHIWRCNGPCQHRKPFFGFVRRAMNRAPGPNDNWWKEHEQNCGGTFIKVSGPEKTCKKKSGHGKDKSMKHTPGGKDIRDFFHTGTPKKIDSTATNKDQIFKSSNIYTFKDLKMSTSPTNNFIKPVNQPFIMPKVEKTEESKPVIKTEEKKVDANESARVKATVRNFWSSKYPSPNAGKKRPNSTSPIIQTEVTIEMKRKKVPCPICYLSFSETSINEHVDECLSKGKSSQSLDDTIPMDELVKNRNIPTNSQEEDCMLRIAQCPVCNKSMDQKELNEHLETCLKCSFENEDMETEDVICDTVPCPCCMKWVPESTINTHIDECLTFIALKSSLRNE